MAIIAKNTSSGNFTPAPAGAHAAVCVDVVDLGPLEVTYGGKTKSQHKIRLVWQIAEMAPNGKPFTVQQRYTLSLHEKAALRKDLESWRGRQFTQEELSGFDVEAVIGKPCFLNITHNVTQEATYANVAAIMPLPRQMTAPAPKDYVRVKDRPDAQEQHGQAPPHDFGGIDDMDVPF